MNEPSHLSGPALDRGVVLIDRIETFIIRLDGDGKPTRSRPHYDTLFERGTLYSNQTETVFVRIESRDGAVGWGEALTPIGPRIVATIIDEVLAPILLGQDAGRPRVLRTRMQESMRERGHLGGYHADAIAGLDIALWDLVGRSWDLSVSSLLGGAFRSTIPSYVSSIAGATDAERADTIARLHAEGAQRFKLHLGHGVPADLSSYDLLSAAAPGAEFAVDVHGMYSLPLARSLAEGLQERGAWFLESAVPPDDLDGFARLSARSALPIAAGEALRNRFEVAAWLRRDALSIYQPDVGRTGITEAASIVALTDAALREVTPHHSMAFGPALAAGLHIAATTQMMPAFEYQPAAVRNANTLFAAPVLAGPASIELPSGPGLGVELRDELVREIAAER